MKRLSCFRKRIKYKIFLNRIGIYKKEKKKLLSLHKLGCVSAILSKLHCAQLALTLNKLGGVSAILSKLYCAQLALTLHKLGRVSAILSKLYCAQLALTLHK